MGCCQLLLGLRARAVCIAFAVTFVSSAVFLEGATGLAMFAPVWVALLALAFVSTGGRYAVQLAPRSATFSPGGPPAGLHMGPTVRPVATGT